MNQFPVTSNGAAGRGFAMFSGARALSCLPGSDGGALSAGAFGPGVAPGASATGVVLHAETAMLAAVTIAIAVRLGLMIGIRL
jgi:hypothetical protein